MNTDQNTDLFNDWDNLPEAVQAILCFLVLSDETDPDYELLCEIKETIEKLGYTFSYGLDGIPYDLRVI